MFRKALPPGPAAWQRYRTQLAAYAHAPVNYDYAHQAEFTAATGWHRDHYATALPSEAPGPPAPAGSFAAAQRVLWHYTFPPPGLLQGYFDPAQPLAERVMLLRARFLGFVFCFGVRIADVVDEERPAAAGALGPSERVWGYGYRTLQGHFEMGQINFAVHKNLATGAVEFRIDSVSKTGRIRNPFYWLGFRLFGRTLQLRFARQSLARMRALVAHALAQPQTIAAPRG
ncbi:DUF1990 family protein [Hymenobacter sp. RP-2-7]|uniref:DUF1990 family protein n=1 Tax=Hymenobacter polaris TaxID=2682546 RepID=A0A7Y0AE30_9BACT|nr:DUF1990 family protein [Hymenobacter polaris]NML65619.1 DUF1990 family protein [Hymenobacter polaris]